MFKAVSKIIMFSCLFMVKLFLSNNWDAINEFIKKNPKSEILKAPNFDDFKYAGSGSWSGDWHRQQYEILKVEDGHVL